MSVILQDIRYALRTLARSPGYAVVAILTLALGIGANTAVFSFLNGLFLKPLPYPRPEQVVRVMEQNPSGRLAGVATLNYLDWQAQSRSFQFLAAQAAGWNPTLTGTAEPRVLRGAQITARYFDIAQIKPFLGRTFLAEEEQPGKDQVVVLSYAIWVSAFGADRALIGKRVLLNGMPFTIVGVMPGGTIFDRSFADIWKPLAFEPAKMNRDLHWFGAFGRLQPGVTLEQSRAEMNTLAGRLALAHPDSNKNWGVRVDRFADILLSDDTRSAVSILMAAALLVLLSACVNLANLALARGAAREREVAVRAALGAGRGRLVGQFLTENIMLALCGGACGVALGYALMKWLNALIPPGGLPGEIVVEMDARVMMFAAVISVVTGLLFGLAPALQAARLDLAGVMKEGGRGSSSGNTGKGLRSFLIVAEVALAFVLLAGSGLLIRSFFGLLNSDPGFDGTNVLTMRMATPVTNYPDDQRLNTYLRQIRAAVNAVPGVVETAFASAVPLRGWGYRITFDFPARGTREKAQRPNGFIKMVSPSYFETVGIHLRQGRGLTERDVHGSPNVLVMNDTMAKKYFAGQNPVSQQIVMPEVRAGQNEFGPDQTWEVVGVIADEKIDALNDDTSTGVYVSSEQVAYYNPNLVVRAAINPRLLEKAVRQAILSVNKNQPVSNVQTLDEIKDEAVAANRLQTVLLGAFALTALLLAATGIYGVISYSVTQRTNEMGIRAALGASAHKLQALVLSGGMVLTIIGLIIGLAGALAVTRLMASMLYGVGAQDPIIMSLTALILCVVALLACYFPARRATKVDPMTALRHE